ncbi:MAG: MBL fold metallo-hydrolase [Patescibacteria group bacterium]
MSIKYTIHGGAQEVTGANHLLEINSKKLLIDCGLFQGAHTAEEKNYEEFPYSPADMDILFITHAHLDHIGRIPKLVREGFNGKIISTSPTRDIAELMLDDSLGILTKEAHRDNRDPLYNEEDIYKAMDLWGTVDYDKEFNIDEIKVVFRDAGHILGSAMIELEIEGRKIVFTGDLGNPPVPLLKPTYELKKADYLIIESTYGNKEHEDRDKRKLKIERAIEETVRRGGTLMIPAFSIERTQELLFEINDLAENGRIPKVPIFLDSPLAINVTKVYKKYDKLYNKNAKYIIDSGDDVFNFPGLKLTLTTEESKAINDVGGAKVVIAGSGMSTGGRIIHHEKRYLSDPRSILLLVGFQAAGSLGRQLVEGVRRVKIFGDEVEVNATIESVRGYSAHPDMNGLFDFVEKISNLKKVFVVQGEAQASLFFSQRIRDYLGLNATAPRIGDSFELM